jgi:hypothetical protein
MLAEGYGRTLRDLASSGLSGRQRALFSWRDVRGIQWLAAIGASLFGAAVLLAILITALPTTPRNGVPDATREAALGSTIRSSHETPYPPHKLPQDSHRVALAHAEARESRQREQQVSK